MATPRHLALIGLGALLLAPPVGAQVAVSVQWLYPMETLYLADLSGYTQSRQPEFLSVSLLNGAAQPQQIVLEVTFDRLRPSSAQIFLGTTDPFVLSGTGRRLTNRDLSCENCEVGIENAQLADDFETLLAESGRFPAGSYLVTVRALQPGGVELDRGSATFELANPSRIELLSPGRPFGDTPEILSGQTPRFVWSSDAGMASGGGEYTIRVVRVEAAASAEDAIQGFANWEGMTTATTALYPGSVSAIPLEPGGTYAWQVVRAVRSSAGTDPLESPIYSPGRPFGDTPEILSGQTPRFVWSSDAGMASGGGEYTIRVVRVEAAASAEDAIQGFANWEGMTTATTALYPGSVSAIPLEPGGTYAWQVVRAVRSSAGTDPLESPIYWFRMAEAQIGADQGSGGDVGAGNQLALLAQLLGLGDELSGFRPTGQILVDGQPVPADQLEELLRAIQAGEISINSINVR